MKHRQTSRHSVDRAAKTQLIEQPVSADEAEQTNEGVREEVRATLSALMPWGVSILAHVGLIVLAFFLVWQTITQPNDPPKPVKLSNAPDMIHRAPEIVQEQVPDAGSPPLVPLIKAADEVKVVVPGFDKPAPFIPEPGIGHGGELRGPGKGNGIGPGTLIGPPKVGGPKDFAFVIDASGSMVDVLPFVINELKKLLNNHGQTKRITILFFSGKGVFEVPGGDGVRGLRPLTPKFKADIRQWITLDNHRFDPGGRGGQYATTAIARALSYNPEAVYLLSDNLTGGGLGATQHELMQDDLLDAIHKANTGRPKTRINTIQFLYEDPLVRAGLKPTMDRIAEETGGSSRFLGQQDLKLR